MCVFGVYFLSELLRGMFSNMRQGLHCHLMVRLFSAVFKYDTVHGAYGGTVEHDEGNLIVDGKKIKV